MPHPDTFQACTGQDDGFEPVLLIEAGKAAVDVASESIDGQIGAEAEELCLAPYGGCADPGPWREVFQPGVRRSRAKHDRVSDVVAREVGGEHGALGQRLITGDVLHAVHRDVHGAHHQVAVDLLEERALAAEFSEVTAPLVAGGLDPDDLDR